jgi:hypothetical protein
MRAPTSILRTWQVAILVMAGLVLGSVTLAWPFGRDQGNYAYPAWVWLDGGMPYRDVYVFKPPGTVWVHALAQTLVGPSMTALRVFDLGWSIVTALLLANLAGRWFPRPGVSVVAGVAWLFLYDGFDFWNTCQTDGWMTLPALAAIWIMTVDDASPRPRWPAWLAAGVFLGVAACLKYTAVLFVVPLAAVVLRGPRELVRLVVVGLGVGLTLAVAGAWLWVRGAIPGFLDSQLGLVPTYVIDTARSGSLGGTLAVFVDRLTDLPELRYVLVGVVAGVVPVAIGLVRGEARPSLAALALLVAGAASCAVQGKLFRYHYLAMLPGTALFAALGVVSLLSFVRRGQALVLVGVAAVLLATSPYPARWATLGQLVSGTLTLRAHWATKPFRVNKMSVDDNLAAADFIARETAPGDRVFVWGYDPMVNVLARRKTVSRFLYNYPLAVAWGNPAYATELLDALAADPPRLFLVGSQDATPHVTGTNDDSRQLFLKFTALRDFVTARYVPAATVARFDIYRLRTE